ncbi:unnamed protein product, partial [Closterium sp. Yama58-4]
VCEHVYQQTASWCCVSTIWAGHAERPCLRSPTPFQLLPPAHHGRAPRHGVHLSPCINLCMAARQAMHGTSPSHLDCHGTSMRSLVDGGARQVSASWLLPAFPSQALFRRRAAKIGIVTLVTDSLGWAMIALEAVFLAGNVLCLFPAFIVLVLPQQLGAPLIAP